MKGSLERRDADWLADLTLLLRTYCPVLAHSLVVVPSLVEFSTGSPEQASFNQNRLPITVPQMTRRKKYLSYIVKLNHI